jgi:hypothetical protein
MKTKELISSYDEENDIFVGKISDMNGYMANYDISDGIFLSIDKNNFPVSVQINNASEIFDVEKSILENPDVTIIIECRGEVLSFELSIADETIYATKLLNVFNIPQLSYEIKAN